jgi:hypothetical protein
VERDLYWQPQTLGEIRGRSSSIAAWQSAVTDAMRDEHRKEKDMPNEAGTDTTRSGAPSVDDDLCSDAEAAGDKPEAPVEGEDANGKDEQDPKGSGDAEESEAPQGEQDSGDAGEPAGADAGESPDADADASTEDDLKVVLSINGGRAVIGVQKPSADPHIETFDDSDLPGLAQEVVAVTERARARWEETPRHPAYERPAPPARRRNRRQQGAAQDATGETEQAQQQTLALF